MARPSKLTTEIKQQIGKSVALGMTYTLAAASAGITYQTLNKWLKKGKNAKSGKYFEFYKHINKCNADAALKFLERLREALDAEDYRVCMWILERRFPGSYGRREFRKINSNNKNGNIEIIINDADKIREKII
jgi:transposase